jgi:hypothetical protein
MHEYILVLVDKHQAELTSLDSILDDTLEPFCEDLNYQTVREEVSDEDLDDMLELYKEGHPNLDKSNLESFLPVIPKYFDCAGFISDGELYYTYKTNPNCKWDWWVKGGRWSGVLDPTYKPEEDTRNTETCYMCEGTGIRSDEIGNQARAKNPEYTCNVCNGVGTHLKYSLCNDIGCELDTTELLKILDDKEFVIPCSILAPDLEWVDINDDIEEVREILTTFNNTIAVVVDIHC